jgi:general secretion pathway protein M
MRPLTDRLYPWWEARTLREQRLLRVMVGLAAAVFVWLAIVRPVMGWREAAATDRAGAEQDLAEVQSALQRMTRPSDVPRAVVDLEGFEPLVQRTAEAAGLSLTTGMAASGQLDFRIPSASSSALFGWLSALERTHGTEIVSLGVVENTDATLQVEGSLSRRGSPG